MKLKWTRHEDLAIDVKPCVRREEYLDAMTFKGGGPLFTEIFGPLVGLKEEWEEQGASPAELDLSAFKYRAPLTAGLGVKAGFRLGSWIRQVSDDGLDIGFEDDLGRRLSMRRGCATIPHPESYPVTNMDDWLKIKPRYMFSAERLPPGWLEDAQAALGRGCALCAGIPGGFDELRELMGEENLCLAYYDQPELVVDVLETIGECAFETLAFASKGVRIDVLSTHEDLAGRSGPLIGPDTFREFVKPYYRRVWDMLRERGARLFEVDSDGDINPLLEVFAESGVNCLLPMEPAAGMDMVECRKRLGHAMAFKGGIDKFVLQKGFEAIDAELERKLPPMLRDGGCVLGLDHRIPNGTPLEAYRHYMAKAWEVIRREMATT